MPKPSDGITFPIDDFDRFLVDVLIPKAPAPGRWAAQNAVKHANRAWMLKDVDPQMAVFRAICGEEESATAIFHSLKRLRYKNAQALDQRSHLQKNALAPFLDAIAAAVAPGMGAIFRSFKLHVPDITATKPRIVVHLVVEIDGKEYTAEPVPPLNFRISEWEDGQPERTSLFSEKILAIARKYDEKTVMDALRARANLRNKLLYAAADGIPTVILPVEPGIQLARHDTFRNLKLFFLIDGHPTGQLFAQQGLNAFLGMLGRAPDLDFEGPAERPRKSGSDASRRPPDTGRQRPEEAPKPEILEAGDFHRIYFDASAWNLLTKHPDRERVKATIRERNWIVLPSVVNAAEILRTDQARLLPKSGLPLLRELCADMAALCRPEQPILGRPQEVLGLIASSWRKGATEVDLLEDGGAAFLRNRIEDPSRITADDLNVISEWVAGLEQDLRGFRESIPTVEKMPEARMSAEYFDSCAFASVMSELPPARTLVLTPDEIRRLFRDATMWAAFGAQVAYSIELALQTYSKGQEEKLPGGPDLTQIPYLGVVHEFVTRDGGLYRAATRIAEIMPGQYRPTVTWADEFFAKIGCPLPPDVVSSAPGL